MRPLRPAALVWAAFGILPYLIGAVLLGKVGPLSWGLLGVELVAILATVLVVRDRVPMPWRRTATVAAFATFALACARFLILPFVGSSSTDLDAAAPSLRHVLLLDALADGAFALACLTLAVACVHALWRARSTSGPGSAS